MSFGRAKSENPRHAIYGMECLIQGFADILEGICNTGTVFLLARPAVEAVTCAMKVLLTRLGVSGAFLRPEGCLD